MKGVLLNFRNVHCLQALRSCLDFELHLVAIVQGFVPITNYRFVMDEYIFAICARNKSKALSSIEPFDCSFFHGTNPFLKSYPDQPSGRCTLLIPTLAKNINEHWCQLVDVRRQLLILAMQNFVHQKIIEAVSLIQKYREFSQRSKHAVPLLGMHIIHIVRISSKRKNSSRLF